ncbi:MAG: insulinase family protein [Bacteroidales bacterium]|nr:insulinase family protein [Bacteroidales bacterium]
MYQPDYNMLRPDVVTLGSGRTVSLFRSEATQLLRLDIVFPVGTMHADNPVCTTAAANLMAEAGAGLDSKGVAEYLDFRGVNLDRNADINTSTLSLYFPRRHAGEVIPFIFKLLANPQFEKKDFDIFVNRRKAQLLTNLQKTSTVARRYYYWQMFGSDHPQGRCAMPEDYDTLTVDSVRSFYLSHYSLSAVRLQLAGACDDEVVETLAQTVAAYAKEDGRGTFNIQTPQHRGAAVATTTGTIVNLPVEGSSLATIRIGRLLPLAWDSPQYADFCVLNTILGGYFGSRLMANIREEKGYTYGIYSQSNIVHGGLSFFAVADVDSTHAVDAVGEVCNELQRLRTEQVPQEELDVVRQVMAGDFMRSIDGVFELAERYNALVGKNMDETFTHNYFHAIETATSAQLRSLAEQLLNPADMLQIVAGPQL